MVGDSPLLSSSPDHVPRPGSRGQRLSAPAPMSQFRCDHGGPGGDHDNAVGDKWATSKMKANSILVKAEFSN